MRLWALLILGIFGVMAVARAKNPATPPNLFLNCASEKISLCKDSAAPPEQLTCLIQHGPQLSTGCKQELDRFIEARGQAGARGGGALSAFGGLNAFGPPLPLISYEGRFSPGRESTAFTDNKGSISAPIYRHNRDTVALSLTGGDLNLGQAPPTLSTNKKLPSNLYRAELGAQYARSLDDKKTWGFRSSIGYAGDKILQNSRDLIYSANANYGFPGSGKGYWVLSLFFSNNSPILNYIPIPGFLYIYRTPTFSGMFGFPVLALQWTPIFPWGFSLSVFGPTIQSEVTYGSIERAQLFTGFYWNRQRYLLDDRTQSKDRLTLQEKKIALGIRVPLWRTLLTELQGGRVFSRSAYIGNGISNHDGGYTPIRTDWIISWGIKAKF